ncbi:MAG: DNA starvation/stationary phase protection protein [Anaerolineae bacterium]|nr:DNA starvation/stationary phase protection protein [Anaerolineae bacterium]
MIEKLNGLVADFTVFYQKLRHYHWNVKGKEFFKLHEKFEEIYTEVGDQIDEIAERIVGLEGTPLHTLGHMLENTALNEDPDLPGGAEMVARTVADIESLSARLQDAIQAAEEADDRPTVNLLDGIHDGLQAHLWMLKAWQG